MPCRDERRPAHPDSLLRLCPNAADRPIASAKITGTERRAACSTRGEAPALSFSEALLAGLARDGGLYVPKAGRRSGRGEIAGFAGMPYAEVAERVIGPLADGDIEAEALGA